MAQNFQFTPFRKTARGEIRIGEIAFRARIGAIEQIDVHPFIIEHFNQRAPHPRILKQGPAQVHRKSLHTGWDFVADFLLGCQAPPRGGEIITGCPIAGDIFLPEINLPSLEGFKRYRGITKIFVANGIEIGHAPRCWQIAPPIIRHAAQHHAAIGIEAFNAISAGTKRQIKAWAGEVAPFPIMLGQDRHFTQNQRQFPVFIGSETIGYAPRIFRHHFRHIRPIGTEEGPAIGAQRVEGKYHIFRRDGPAIMPAGTFAQFKGHALAVRRQFNDARQMAVLRKRFIQIARQQRIINQITADRGRTTQDERVETVERPKRGECDFAAFGGVRVHPGPMREIRRQGGFAQ